MKPTIRGDHDQGGPAGGGDRAVDGLARLVDPSGPGALQGALLTWFDLHRRELPWRREVNPYRVLVSEFMLQQTRVDTVIPYFDRWMQRFPSLDALASAPEEEVLQVWTGLGYYSRARNLQALARQVRTVHGGTIPAEPDLLRRLPGVGPYTAGAIASIAFARPVPLVDGNVRRVLARWLDEPDPSPARLSSAATRLLEPNRPGDWNQGLMELGSLVCTPIHPRCGECPVSPWCAARAAGTVSERPLPKTRPRPRRMEVVTLVLRDAEGRLLLRRRPEGGLLGGMWEFPGEETTGKETTGKETTRQETTAQEGPGPRRSARITDPAFRSAAARTLALRLIPGATLADGEGHLPAVEHRFTHRIVRYHPVRIDLIAAPSGSGAGAGGAEPPSGEEPDPVETSGETLRWLPPPGGHGSGLPPIPAAQQRILSLTRADAPDEGEDRP